CARCARRSTTRAARSSPCATGCRKPRCRPACDARVDASEDASQEGAMKRAIGLVAVVAWLCAGCASSEQPSVAAYPTKGQSPEQQARAANECRGWAHQQTGYDPTTDTAKGAGVGLAIGAIGGAATGAALGAATGNRGAGRRV